MLERYNIRVGESAKKIPILNSYHYETLLHHNPPTITSN